MLREANTRYPALTAARPKKHTHTRPLVPPGWPESTRTASCLGKESERVAPKRLAGQRALGALGSTFGHCGKGSGRSGTGCMYPTLITRNTIKPIELEGGSHDPLRSGASRARGGLQRAPEAEDVAPFIGRRPQQSQHSLAYNQHLQFVLKCNGW